MHANKNDELLPVYLESFCVCSFAYSAMSNVINSTSLCWIEPKYNEYVYVCVCAWLCQTTLKPHLNNFEVGMYQHCMITPPHFRVCAQLNDHK